MCDERGQTSVPGEVGTVAKNTTCVGNFCMDGTDQGVQGDPLGTKVGMCCFNRASHAAD